jgi:CheY-like chemotaxis protein/tRNA A-37 threonylcarbamoyl transferase component Bud32
MSQQTILVVDDQADGRRAVRGCLERAGLRCDSAPDGEAALAMLGRGDYDAMVLDLQMPGMSGGEVLAKVRGTKTGLDLPVLVATAEADPAAMVRLLDAGANDYLTKPLRPGVLIARLQNLLRFRRQARAASVPSQATPEEIRPGTVLDGRWRLGAAIGAGGFGTVYSATDLTTDRAVAVKVLHRVHRASPTIRRRFELECQVAGQLRHPNAVELIEVGATHADTPYFVMELLFGHELVEEVEKGEAPNPLPGARIAQVMLPVLDLLECMHARGVVHRDVKLENIFLHRGPEGREVVKVLDFGVAKLTEMHENLTGINQLVGTPHYMPPEQLRGLATDPRVDVYAVGVVLYLLLARQFPYQVAANSPLAVAAAKLSSPPRPLAMVTDLAGVVMRALAANPDHRPSLATLREAITRHAAWDLGRPKVEDP